MGQEKSMRGGGEDLILRLHPAPLPFLGNAPKKSALFKPFKAISKFFSYSVTNLNGFYFFLHDQYNCGWFFLASSSSFGKTKG